ncbi:DUF6492 family protein [Acuticoccus sp. I52.16.1]|uniref:DUF6492 family protein n=1 Tax=Acuticoccus sp. I52.16.1 TaxID=2928472 RepID=UPI001FCF898C|nr:DUF6492 family protein [Acuticoccus sp. I52.16.1]UOM34915.1 DUF6492 family protein [Acuticoccus sp. I52.16.1]
MNCHVSVAANGDPIESTDGTTWKPVGHQRASTALGDLADADLSPAAYHELRFALEILSRRFLSAREVAERAIADGAVSPALWARHAANECKLGEVGTALEAARNAGDAALIAEIERVQRKVYWRTAPVPARVESDAGPLERIGLFIKTFPGDAEQLAYLLRSIDKYCRGFSQLVIVSDEGFEPGPLPTSLPVSVAYERVPQLEWCKPRRRSGYWFQQGVKLTWPRYCNCDAVITLDSDVVVTGEMTPRSFLRDGAPMVPHRPWGALKTPHPGPVWKLSADYLLGAPTTRQHMVWPGAILTRKATTALDDYIRAHLGTDAMDVFLRDPEGLRLSEFEFFGTFVTHVESHGYVGVPFHENRPPIRKFQSTEPLTEAHLAEIAAILA